MLRECCMHGVLIQVMYKLHDGVEEYTIWNKLDSVEDLPANFYVLHNHNLSWDCVLFLLDYEQEKYTESNQFETCTIPKSKHLFGPHHHLFLFLISPDMIIDTFSFYKKQGKIFVSH